MAKKLSTKRPRIPYYKQDMKIRCWSCGRRVDVERIEYHPPSELTPDGVWICPYCGEEMDAPSPDKRWSEKSQGK